MQNGNQQPDYVCRTVYDEGVFCFPVEYSKETGKVVVSGPAHDFVIPSQIKDICTLHIDPTYEHNMKGVSTTVTTGLEVVWGASGRSDAAGTSVVPEMVIFGCYGAINTKGNLTSVHRDGTIVQTIPGAYPGSVLFGVEVLNRATKPKAIEPPPRDSNVFRDQHYGDNSSSTSSGGIFDTMSTLGLFLGMVLVALVSVMINKKKGRTVLAPSNGLLNQQEGSGGNYIELPTVSFDEERNIDNDV